MFGLFWGQRHGARGAVFSITCTARLAATLPNFHRRNSKRRSHFPLTHQLRCTHCPKGWTPKTTTLQLQVGSTYAEHTSKHDCWWKAMFLRETSQYRDARMILMLLSFIIWVKISAWTLRPNANRLAQSNARVNTEYQHFQLSQFVATAQMGILNVSDDSGTWLPLLLKGPWICARIHICSYHP